MSSEDLIAKFGSDERQMALMAEPFKKWHRKFWSDSLELDPNKHTDPAREFLAERGWPLKTPRAVLDQIRKSWDARPKNTLTAAYRQSADALIAQCKTDLNGRTIYKIPTFLLESAADHAKQQRREYKRRAQGHDRSRKECRPKICLEKSVVQLPGSIGLFLSGGTLNVPLFCLVFGC